MDADVLVIGVPVYNFGIPASLKAWVDMIARARLTFRYTESGPVGLLRGKRAVLVVASGGTAVGSEIDFATDYLRHVLGFLGIDDVEIIAANRVMPRGEDEVLGAARRHIEQLVPWSQPLRQVA
jgi:FMN-dependent NADH-azoreductase